MVSGMYTVLSRVAELEKMSESGFSRLND